MACVIQKYSVTVHSGFSLRGTENGWILGAYLGAPERPLTKLQNKQNHMRLSNKLTRCGPITSSSYNTIQHQTSWHSLVYVWAYFTWFNICWYYFCFLFFHLFVFFTSSILFISFSMVNFKWKCLYLICVFVLNLYFFSYDFQVLFGGFMYLNKCIGFGVSVLQQIVEFKLILLYFQFSISQVTVVFSLLINMRTFIMVNSYLLYLLFFSYSIFPTIPH